MAEDADTGLTSLTADVVSAYVSNNRVTVDELATLIGATYEALKGAGAPAPSEPQFAKADKAAIKKSAQPDYLTSFIDGCRYKSLKRHLTTHGLSPNEYRERYGLPQDYPMVASGYSAQRREVARSLGLGRRAGQTASTPESPEPAEGRAEAQPSADASS